MGAPLQRPANDPARSRARAVVTLLLAVAALITAVRMPDGGRGFTLQLALGMGGLTVVPFALVCALIAHVNVRRFERMRRGEGVLARWTVEPRQWQAFVEQSRRLDAAGTGPRNSVTLHAESPPAGVDVVVSDNALYVNGQFHPLEKDVSVTVHDSFMEFQQVIHDPDGPNIRTLLRIPLPASARLEGERIRRHYAAAYAAAASNPRTKIYIALGFAVFILIFVVWGVISETSGR